MTKVYWILNNVLPFIALGVMACLAFVGVLTLMVAPHLRCTVTP